jgi:hypothetical protein
MVNNGIFTETPACFRIFLKVPFSMDYEGTPILQALSGMERLIKKSPDDKESV